MPFIGAKLSIELDDSQKLSLQDKLMSVVGAEFGKPKAYIMSEIEDNRTLYMGGNKLEKGAFISVSLLGSASKEACGKITSKICSILREDYNIDGSHVYVTYHPVDLWGWNGMMF